MTKSKQNPVVELWRNGQVRFGGWLMSGRVRRCRDIRDCVDHGLVLELGGGGTTTPLLQVPFLPPGASMDPEDEDAISERVAAALIPVAERFMHEIVETMARVAKEEAAALIPCGGVIFPLGGDEGTCACCGKVWKRDALERARAIYSGPKEGV